MPEISWNSATSGDWSVASNWNPGTVPGAQDNVTIGLSGYYAVTLAVPMVVNTLTISNPSATLQIPNPAGSVSVSGNVGLAGALYLDAYGVGGTTLAVGGTLTTSGSIGIGNGGMTQADLLTLTGPLLNTGQVTLTGGQAGAGAKLDIGGVAPATLLGAYSLLGNAGGAVLQWASSGITQIGDGNTIGSDLYIDGSNAFVETGGTAGNSALTGLATIASNGVLDLRDGATVSTTGDLTVAGGSARLKVDAYGGAGGSTVTIGGSLTNSSFGSFSDGGVGVGSGGMTHSDTLTVQGVLDDTSGLINVIGGQAGASANLDIVGAVASTLAGNYSVVGNAGGALLQWGSGGITQIGDGASNDGYLYIDGSNAFAEIGTTNTNSALTGLATIASNGVLDLRDGATVSTTGDLTVAGGSARLKVDAYGGAGGSTVTIGGNLTNSSFGSFSDGGVSVGNGYMTQADTLTVAGTLNNAGGLVTLTGGQAGAGANLDIGGAAPATLLGNYNVVGDAGGAVLQWGSGSITQIGDGTTNGSYLYIDGSNAFAEIGASNSNSALTGLTTIASNGVLDLRDGATVSLTGDLSVLGGNARLKVDSYGGAGGSTVAIGGNLTNGSFGSFSDGGVSVGNGYMTQADTLTVAGTLNNVGGLVTLTGGQAGAGASLDIGGAVSSTLLGNYSLVGNAGGAVLQWGSGSITQIGDGNTIGSNLYIDGSNAFVETGGTAGNSALTGLATIASNGVLDLRDGATMATAGDLTVAGGSARLKVDAYGGAGGSSVTIGGNLTNSSFGSFGDGGVSVGNGYMTQADTLTVAGTLNNVGGLVTLTGGQAGAGASLDIGGAVSSTLLGNYSLVGNAGGAVLQWGSGSITQIGDGNTIGSNLYIDGSNAFVETAGTAGNSALSGLATIASNGLLDLRDGVTVATTGDLTVAGGSARLKVDAYGGAGGSDVTVGGNLTNSSFGSFSDGGVSVGNAYMTAASTLAVTGRLDSTGIVTLTGNAGNSAGSATLDAAAASLAGTVDIGANALLDVSGAATLEGGGDISLAGGTLTATSLTLATGATLEGQGIVQAPITSSGSIIAQGGTLDLAGGLAAAAPLTIDANASLDLGGADSGRVTFAGTGAAFVLDAPGSFTGTISGLAVGDTLVLRNTDAVSVTPTYDANTATTTLAVALAGGGSLDFTLAGNYASDAFTVDLAGKDSQIAAAGAAVGTIVTALPISFGTLRSGSTASLPLTIENNAGAGSAALDASIGGVSGGATASGTISALQPGSVNTSGITVGLNTTQGGVENGAVIVDFASDAGGGVGAPLPAQTIAVSGTVFQEAVASIAPVSFYAHLGGPGVLTLDIANTAPANGYSENLIAALSAVSGGFTIASSGTGDIAAGKSGTLTLDYATSQTGTISGQVTIALSSDGGTGAGSVDGLGTVSLPSETLPLNLQIDNYATAAFGAPLTYGSLSQSGATTTLDLGQVAESTGPWAINFAVANSASGPADQLSGSLSATAAAGFSLTSLGSISSLGAGQSVSETITLDTTQGGVVTQTITLSPTDSNPGGYSAALAPETLVVTGTITSLPSPTITVSNTLSAIAGVPVQFGTLSISDPNSDTLPLTLTVTDQSGSLAAQMRGKGSVAGNGSNTLVLTGSVSDINAELATLAYTATAAGTDKITLDLTDQHHASTTQTVSVLSLPVPFTAPVVNTPSSSLVSLGQQSGIGGLSVTDPYAVATGQTITVNFLSAAPLTITGNSGAIITGQGTNIVSLTGTVEQINADLADGLEMTFLETLAGSTALGNGESALFSLAEQIGSGTVNGAALQQDFQQLIAPPTAEGAVAAVAGAEGAFFVFGIEAASYALNLLTAQIAGGGLPNPGSFLKAAVDLVLHFAGHGLHVVSPGGYLYNLDAVGEFVLAASTQPGDSLLIQGRLEAVPGSSVASELTQVAALVGNDRVTFDSTRPAVVWVDGKAVSLSVGTPVALSGGTLSQISSTTYQIIYNTGEAVTVTDEGSYLDVSIAPSANNPAGSIVGLANNSNNASEIFSAPNGTYYSGSLTPQQFYTEFVSQWAVPQALSLLDYGVGQTTATFTNTAFAGGEISLSDLPSTLVAQAASVVAAAGIQDPGLAAAAEFDYIVSGGDPSVVFNDANQFGDISTVATSIISSGSAPSFLGVMADQASVKAQSGTVTPVVFDVYLTGALSTATTVNYAVTDGGAGFLGAAAFGGTLPSGSLSIQPGTVEQQFTINLPTGALGTLPSEKLKVQITSADGTPIFVGSAQDAITQAIAGPPPVPALVDLTNFGSFVQEGNNYVLNLGSVQAGQPLPNFQFGIENTASGASDFLGGSLTYDTVEGFTVSGASLPAALAAGQGYQGLTVSATDVKFGQNSETIAFTPTDTNNTGFSSSLAPITLTINDTVVPPSMVYSYAWGDVHIITFNGLTYNFQGEGEFTLVKSRIPDDSFDIQMRLQPWTSNDAVTVITQVAVSVGTDRVTFDTSRADTIYVDGTPTTLSAADPSITLNGGTLTAINSTTWQINWNTGEEATITEWGSSSFFNISDGIPIAAPGFYAGLQGEDQGTANDFQLSNGTVLAQPLTTSELYGQYADSWRVSQAASLFDYLPGQTTATFTDRNFPGDVVSLSSLPSSIVSAAQQMLTSAGVTDAGIAQAAALDYLATGSTAFIQAAQQISTEVTGTTPVSPTVDTPVIPALGVDANPVGYTEAASGATAVTFDIYLTSVASTDIVANYTVVAPGSGYLGASAFGGTLPSGSVTIAAGGTIAAVTIDVPQGALGTLPTDQLELAINSPGSVTPIFAPSATAAINNYAAEAGTPPIAQFLKLNAPGTLTETSPTAYTLDFGQIIQGQTAVLAQLGLANEAAAPADALTGTFGVPTGSGFLVSGNSLPGAIAAGAQYGGLYITAQSATAGQNTETLIFNPADVNSSGYDQALSPITLTILDTVTAPGIGALNSPDVIVFPNAHVGTAEAQTISVSNTGAAPISVSVFSYSPIISTGSISALAAGATDNTSLSVGVNTSAAGAQSGQVLVNLGASDPPISVFGNVYRLATSTITAPGTILHVGDPGTIALDVMNTAASDGYSENLLGALTAANGGFTPLAGVPTGEIAAGGSNTSSLVLGFDTAKAGTISGSATVSLASDGGTGTGSIDGLGTTALAPEIVPLNLTIDNYATAALSSNRALTQTGQNSFTLNLGTAQQNAGGLAADLVVGNSAQGPADWLNGSFTVSGPPAFSNGGFSNFGTIGAGGSINAGTIALSTSQSGVFQESIVLSPTDTNTGGYAAALAGDTITVVGTVVPTGSANGDVHMVTFDGLHYNFQAVGDFVLARTTTPGDNFQVQIATVAEPANRAVSVTHELAAQIGSDVVQFTVGATNLISVDGVADTTLNASNPVQALGGGSLHELSPNTFMLSWNSGESLVVTDTGTYLNSSTSLGPQNGPGSVQGLLGGDSGQANDFQLPDGTVLTQPLDQSTLLGQFAQGWSVSPGQSLLSGGAGASGAAQFISAEGLASTQIAATTPGQVLVANGSAEILSDPSGLGVIFTGAMAALTNATIAFFGRNDLIDVSNLNSTTATLSYGQDGQIGLLQVSDGTTSGVIRFSDTPPTGSFMVTSDHHGGSLILLK